MTYNTTTKGFTMEDSSGSYRWITEGLDPKDSIRATDAELRAWVETLLEFSKEQDWAEVERRAEEYTYPRFGYTTNQVHQSADEYLNAKRQEIEDDYAGERQRVFDFLKMWIEDARLTTNEAAEFVGVRPLTITRWIKNGWLKPVYHQARFNLYTVKDVQDAKDNHPKPGRKAK